MIKTVPIVVVKLLIQLVRDFLLTYRKESTYIIYKLSAADQYTRRVKELKVKF